LTKRSNGSGLKITKVYGGSSKMLVHFRYLRLKINRINHFG